MDRTYFITHDLYFSLDSMLAFDIETTGLSKHRDRITVTAIYDEEQGLVENFCFTELAGGEVVYREDYLTIAEQFMHCLDTADMLCAFNGVGFDIPFIQLQFQVAADRVQRWVMKTLDIHQICKTVLAPKRTFGLNHVLGVNGFEVKTGDGLIAVKQAHAGKWKELQDYCMDDARLTYEVSRLNRILIPEGFAFRKANGGSPLHENKRLFLCRDDNGDVSFETKFENFS
jgi:DNA polymerase III epsilon subunit-like protein